MTWYVNLGFIVPSLVISVNKISVTILHKVGNWNFYLCCSSHWNFERKKQHHHLSPENTSMSNSFHWDKYCCLCMLIIGMLVDITNNCWILKCFFFSQCSECQKPNCNHSHCIEVKAENYIYQNLAP